MSPETRVLFVMKGNVLPPFFGLDREEKKNVEKETISPVSENLININRVLLVAKG